MSIRTIRIFLMCLLLGLFVIVGTKQFVQASFIPSPAPRGALQLTTSLQLTPSTPSVGQPVTARFTIHNSGGSAINLQKLGVGGRGPSCVDWTCNTYADFLLRDNVSLGANQSYSYEAERIYWESGSYFAQTVYQDDGGTWYFTGNRVDFNVGDALRVASPLELSSTLPLQNRLVFAEFTLRNDGSEPLFFRSVGIGTRGPNCANLNWDCSKIAEFPYAKNVTLQPGESRRFEMWREFADVGNYFAQVTVQDVANVWHRLGDAQTLMVQPTQRGIRLSPWKMGAHYHPVWNSDDVTRLQLAQSAEIDIIRIAVSWNLLETDSKGAWATNWYIPRLTEVIDTANNLGIDVYLMLQSTPCWASSDPNRDCDGKRWNTAYPPRNSADYAAAMRKLVNLYRNKVVAWEVWNEPNTSRFWAPAPNAAAYTDLLQKTYAAVKAENPSATVLGGSMAGADMQFMLAMYDAGVRGHFDALALHPYSGTAAPTACPNLRSSYACGVESIRDMMLHLDDGKPIWFTEYGWSSYGGNGGVGLQTQRRYLQQSVDLIGSWDFVPVATWYNLIETSSSSGALEFEDHMGLFNINYVAKPAGRLFPIETIDLSDFAEKLFLPVARR